MHEQQGSDNTCYRALSATDVRDAECTAKSLLGRMASCSHSILSVVPHPNGGSGGSFTPRHAFWKVRAFVGPKGVTFPSTTGENRGNSKQMVVRRQSYSWEHVLSTETSVRLLGVPHKL